MTQQGNPIEEVSRMLCNETRFWHRGGIMKRIASKCEPIRWRRKHSNEGWDHREVRE